MHWAVIPAYNESGTICEVIHRAVAAGFSVIVIDDGSTDDTGEQALKCGASVVEKNITNLGYEVSLNKGMQAAANMEGCTWVLTLDADGQLDPEDGKTLIKLAEKEEASR